MDAALGTLSLHCTQVGRWVSIVQLTWTF
jgi:hypothetical protein